MFFPNSFCNTGSKGVETMTTNGGSNSFPMNPQWFANTATRWTQCIFYFQTSKIFIFKVNNIYKFAFIWWHRRVLKFQTLLSFDKKEKKKITKPNSALGWRVFGWIEEAIKNKNIRIGWFFSQNMFHLFVTDMCVQLPNSSLPITLIRAAKTHWTS